MQTGRADHKLAAVQHAERVLEKLKNYVVDPAVFSALPNGGKLSGDTAGTWALSPGYHDVSGLITSDPVFVGLTGVSMTYCVADAGTTQTCPGSWSVTCPAGSAFKCVQIKVTWDELRV